MTSRRKENERNLKMETLETRTLLAADLGYAELSGVAEVTSEHSYVQDQREIANMGELDASQNGVQRVVESSRSDFESSLPQFAEEPGLFQIYSNYGRTGQINLETGSFDVAPMNAGTRVNAAGFRIADNYAYGIVSSTKEVARIGANGQIESLGNVDGLPMQSSYYVGDFADDGLLYIRGSHDLRTFYGINVDTLQVENEIHTTDHLVSIYDIAFNNVDQKFYASTRGAENYLISIDMEGTVEKIGNNDLQKRTFGAMYADANGNVYGGCNQSGEVYRFNTETGKATLVGKGPTSGTNDGFSNASLVLDLPPLAADDVIEIKTISSSSGNLFKDMGNGEDVDGNNDPFHVSMVNGEEANVNQTIKMNSGSEFVVASNGDYKFKPSAGYANLTVNQQVKESFTYTITDPGGQTSTATVEVTIVGVKEVTDLEGVRVTGFEAFGGPSHMRLVDAGDVNGDGYTDGMASLHTANRGTGMTAVVYGSADGFEKDFNINRLRDMNGADGSEGVLINGANMNDLSGYSISAVGDFNGDNVDDIVIGAKDADGNGVRNSGESYVVYGNREGLGSEMSLKELYRENGGDGSRGVVLKGIGAHDLSGANVKGLGDFNGDGLNDIAISAHAADVDGDRKNAGQTYVVYGSKDFDAEYDLKSLTADGGNDGSQGMVINGVRKHDLSGADLSAGGDVNGDGINDLVINARYGDCFKLFVDAGQSYVIFGGEGNQGAELELSTILEENGGDCTRGITINGSKRFVRSGSYVSMVDDLNDDGIDDLIVGIRDPNALDTYTVFGGSEIMQCDFELADLVEDTLVLADNFDRPEDIHDDRDWDRFPYSLTMHSNQGTQVTIWGDPHVVIKMDGMTRRFDIALGYNEIELHGGVTVSWDTAEADWDRFPKGPPLTWFSIDAKGTDMDQKFSLEDSSNFIDEQTALTDGQLRQFARVLWNMKIT